eukprot:TRINITY_DN56642_c0_g1_i2.p1 TRINITY_DN56642_c0_g1~~TRINITY_DN56642_c0_g1_i2.p1  ORF type:complete len:257 (+),score=58.33 TRINITY_DN56642_c0_g1_i2:77-847(+)
MGCGGSKANAVHLPTKKDGLPASIAAAPRGKFQSTLPPRDEGRRDFARIFFAEQRKIYLFAKGMPSMRPLQPTAAPSSASIGDLSEEVIKRAEELFTDSLVQTLTTAANGTRPTPDFVEKLTNSAMNALTVNVGIDFALHMKLMPTFLQPIFVIIVLGDPAEARAATYGFVASAPQEVAGDRPEAKRTPFCVRLLSPNLLRDGKGDSPPSTCDDSDWEVQYSVREVQAATILQAVEPDTPKLMAATASGRWDPMLT